MARNTNQTSSTVAILAANTLRAKNSSDISKQLAATALAQTGTGKQTGKEMEAVASKVLRSDKYSDDTKTLAATVLAQSNKER